jgi:peptidoglycan/LPS O-acetylase OafA/YrhL
MDSVRGIAILLVVVNHCTALSGAWAAPVWGHWALYADIGVAVFFVLSGFLLYRPFAVAHAGVRAAPRVTTYFRRRVLRIVPGFWLALTVLAIWPGVPGVFTGDWWRYYFFGQVYSAKTVTLGVASAWSLCVEATFYLLLPLFAAAVSGLVARRARRPWWQVELVALGAFAAFGLACVAAQRHFEWPRPWTYTLPTVTEWFAVGMGLAVATVAMQGRERSSRLLRVLADYPGLSWALAVAVFAIGIYPLDIRTAQPASTLHFVGNRIAFGLTALLIVAPAAFEGRGLVRRILGLRFLAWIGLISYGIFLWHFAIASWLIDFRPGISVAGLHWFAHLSQFKTILLLGATLLLSGAVASASYYLVELRFLRLKELPLRLAFRRAQAVDGA